MAVWHIKMAWLPAVGIELPIILASLYFSFFCNNLFWSAALNGRHWTEGGTWRFAIAMFVMVTALHCVLLGLLITRQLAKPIFALLFIVTALATHSMEHYTVFFDPDMVRNVLRTDVAEARELLSADLLWHVLVVGIVPTVLMIYVRLSERSWRRAVVMRAAFLLSATAVSIACGALVFQDLSSLMRNHKEVRYLLTPGNYIVSAARVWKADTEHAQAARIAVGSDATLAAAWRRHDKPTLLLLVVGETARAANWGLNGYARQTTPKLAASDVINFTHVTSCGTNTEVSLPCMFSPYGRNNYDENRIRRHESLLHVLERSGIKTLWRDNQSGCKGVCDGLEQQQLDKSRHTTLCNAERCYDEILLDNLDKQISQSTQSMVIVLHQLGNHGPAYFRRHPDAFRQFAPTCDSDDLGKCSQQQIINSYDNALLYTDHILNQAIALLKAQNTHNAALLYVSDHGESLGEMGIYLHGMPYAIAPKQQTEVPMVMWLSEGFASSFSVNIDCLKRGANRPISHDYLFHSILGLLQVKTQVYNKSFDFTAPCQM